MKRLIAFTALAAAMAVLALAGAGCVIARTKPAGSEIQPRDLTPVTWMEAPSHPPVEIVRDGMARAVAYVVDPTGREPFVPKRRGERPPMFKQFIDHLVESVQLATGAKLEVVDQSPPADRPAIVIGDCAETRQAGIDAAQIPVEGFVVKTAPNRVYLVGSTQALPVPRSNDGTSWAVADFLVYFYQTVSTAVLSFSSSFSPGPTDRKPVGVAVEYTSQGLSVILLAIQRPH